MNLHSPREPTVTHWSVFVTSNCPSIVPGVSLQLFNCCSRWWSCDISGVPLTPWGGSASLKLYHCHWHWQLYVFSGIPLPLTKMSVSFQVYYCHLMCWVRVFSGFSLKWVHIIPSVSVPHIVSQKNVPSVQLQLTKAILCHTKWTIAPHCGDSVSFQVFYCQSPGLLCIVLGVPLLLTGVSQCHSMFLSSSEVGGSLSSQEFHHRTLGHVCSLLGIPLFLLLLLLNLPHLSCLIAAYWGGSISF